MKLKLLHLAHKNVCPLPLPPITIIAISPSPFNRIVANMSLDPQQVTAAKEMVLNSTANQDPSGRRFSRIQEFLQQDLQQVTDKEMVLNSTTSTPQDPQQATTATEKNRESAAGD